MTDQAARLARLTPQQRALLMRRLAPRNDAILRRDGTGPGHLSFAQRRLWFVQTRDPSGTAYNMATVLRLRGPLDAAAMSRAFSDLTARHDVLRSAYVAGPDGEPQCIPAPPPELAVIEAEGDAKEALRHLTSRPYDLNKVPVRPALVKLAEDDHFLVIGMHHITADRAAMGILIRDLAALYLAQLSGTPAPLPTPAIRMTDFADWQRSAKAEAVSDQIGWWRAHLADAPVLDLPRSRLGGAERGGFHAFDLTPELARTARTAAQSHGVTLFTWLLAVFHILLMRYSDSDDVVLGTDVSNRDRPETRDLVGPLVNTLALRTDLSGAAHFGDVLGRVGATLKHAYDHADVPLDQVIEALNPRRSKDEVIPLFRAKFDLQQVEPLPNDLNGVRIERAPFEETQSKYELRFNLEDHGDAIRGRVEYRADLYAPETIDRMARHFLTLVQAASDRGEQPLDTLPMLGPIERDHLLELARGPALPAHEDTLHQAFEAQVDQSPDAPAITHGTETWSYADLDRHANVIAARLIARQLPPESRVGIRMARSARLVATILGVLKAGCAYVPLDPAYPQDRIDHIVRDAGVDLILTDDHEPDFSVADRPAPRGESQGLAVVIYTSGSTGRPKGVALEHRNIMARIAWARGAYQPEDFTGMLFGTSVSFDLSLFELFATLAVGGRLIVAGTLLDLPHLPPEPPVTFIVTVPSLLRELIRHHDLPSGLRAINLAGEYFPPALLDKLLELPVRPKIFNLYGPTEDAIYDTGNPVHDDPERPMPIGRPLPGTRLYILDRKGNLVPEGVAGEICVAGAGLARGYLNRPDLTAERFVSDPQDGTERLYRTGDRGRWRADGRLDILGRIDTQVKIRGQRIETGEIEARLEARADVAEAVVLATGAPGDIDRQLVAHIAIQGGAAPTIDDLRTGLAQTLPAYMIPARWTLARDLPRLPNGKIDRKELAQRLPDTPPTEPVAPASQTEKQVIAIWQELLECDGIGATDDFFERGGHSLLAMRLLIRLNEAFGTTLTLGQMFDALTPRAQACIIESADPPPEPEETDPTAGLSDAEVDALLAQMNMTAE